MIPVVSESRLFSSSLDRAEIVRALVRRSSDEVEGEAVVGKAQELLQKLVLEKEQKERGD